LLYFKIQNNIVFWIDPSKSRRKYGSCVKKVTVADMEELRLTGKENYCSSLNQHVYETIPE